MTALFSGFVVLLAASVIGLGDRFLGRRTAGIITAALFVWFLYVGRIGYFGVIRNVTMRPPGAAFLFIPVLVFLVFFILRVCSPAGGRLALAFPLWLLIGAQAFRVIVEIFLHELWHAGLVPRMLTYAGANIDIYVGASAPLVAWLSTRARAGGSIVRIWNIFGLLALANVVIRAVLTAPGPLNLVHAEISNLMIGTFPFMYIPGFFVPLAVMLHVMALRAVGAHPRASNPQV